MYMFRLIPASRLSGIHRAQPSAQGPTVTPIDIGHRPRRSSLGCFEAQGHPARLARRAPGLAGRVVGM